MRKKLLTISFQLSVKPAWVAASLGCPAVRSSAEILTLNYFCLTKTSVTFAIITVSVNETLITQPTGIPNRVNQPECWRNSAVKMTNDDRASRINPANCINANTRNSAQCQRFSMIVMRQIIS